MHRDNEILFVKSGLQTQYGRHAHKYLKRFTTRPEELAKCYEPLQKLRVRLWPCKIDLSPPVTVCYCTRDLGLLCSNDYPMMTLADFTASSIFETGFYMEKSENNRYFWNYCCLRPENCTCRQIMKSIKVYEYSRSYHDD